MPDRREEIVARLSAITHSEDVLRSEKIELESKLEELDARAWVVVVDLRAVDRVKIVGYIPVPREKDAGLYRDIYAKDCGENQGVLIYNKKASDEQYRMALGWWKVLGEHLLIVARTRKQADAIWRHLQLAKELTDNISLDPLCVPEEEVD